MKIGYRAHIVQPKFKQQGGAEISSIRTTKQATPGPINEIGETTHRLFFTAGMHDSTVKADTSYVAFALFALLILDVYDGCHNFLFRTQHNIF